MPRRLKGTPIGSQRCACCPTADQCHWLRQGARSGKHWAEYFFKTLELVMAIPVTH